MATDRRALSPLVIAVGKHLGLDAQRAEEAAQVAMGDFALAVRGGKYDPQKGQLRDFVFGIPKKIYDAFKRSPEVQPDSFFFVQRADDDAWERAWDRERQSAIAVQCLRRGPGITFSSLFRSWAPCASADPLRPGSRIPRPSL